MKDPQVAKAISDVERTGSGRQTADKTFRHRTAGSRVMVEGSDRDRLTVLAGDLAKTY